MLVTLNNNAISDRKGKKLPMAHIAGNNYGIQSMLPKIWIIES